MYMNNKNWDTKCVSLFPLFFFCTTLCNKWWRGNKKVWWAEEDKLNGWVAKYTKIHISCGIRIPRKLVCMAAFWFQMCWMNQLMMFMFLAGDMLLAKKHKASRDIRAQMEHLLTAWQQLLQGSNNYGRGLEEAQDILEFNNQAEKVEAWIRDKVCSKWNHQRF